MGSGPTVGTTPRLRARRSDTRATSAVETGLITGADGRRRCGWGALTEDYAAYHDLEWGRPVTDDVRLYEKLCLEGFQSGLSWLTILRKRDNFRAAFAGFDPAAVAAYGPDDVERLMADAGIVRYRGRSRRRWRTPPRCSTCRRATARSPRADLVLRAGPTGTAGPDRAGRSPPGQSSRRRWPRSSSGSGSASSGPRPPTQRCSRSAWSTTTCGVATCARRATPTGGPPPFHVTT